MDEESMPTRPAAKSEGSPLFGGRPVALFDIADGFWGLRRHLESLVGHRLTETVLHQAGVGSGSYLAQGVFPRGSTDRPASGASNDTRPTGEPAMRACLAAYQATGFGRFDLVEASGGPALERAVIVAQDTFETWAPRQRGQPATETVCSYTAGVIAGMAGEIGCAPGSRRAYSCFELECQALGASCCRFLLEAVSADSGDTTKAALGGATDPSIQQQFGLIEILFNRMPMGIAIIDRDLILRRFNPTWAELLARYSATPVSAIQPGSMIWDLTPSIASGLAPLVEQVLAGETVRREGFRLEMNGIVSYWDLALSPLIEQGRVVGLVDVLNDATDRVMAYQLLERRVEERTRELVELAAENARLLQAEQARRHEAEQRREVAEALRGILALLNSARPVDEVLNYIVSEAVRILGTDAGAIYLVQPGGQMLAIESSVGLPADYVSRMTIPVGEGAVGTAAVRREPVVLRNLRPFAVQMHGRLEPEVWQVLSDLAERFQTLLAVPLIVNGEVIGGIVLYYPESRDLAPEQIALASAFGDEAALAIENSRLRARAEQSAVAAERSRLARDLHDAVTQTLFSASLIAEVLPKLWERDAAQGRSRLAELRELTRGALAEMRTLLLELRPTALTEASMPDLLRQLAEATTGRARIPVHVTIDETGSSEATTSAERREDSSAHALSPDVKIALYRIAQEALNNIARHSGAGRAEVRFRRAGGVVTLEVRDDGRGFESSGAFAPEHLGLGIMRERAQAIGAKLEISADVGRGTRILVNVAPDGSPDEMTPAATRVQTK